MRVLKLETQYFHTKPPCQRPMLRQIEWRVHNGHIKRNRGLLVTTLLLWKFCFSIRTSDKELIWCTNYPNVRIYTFGKRWSFICEVFFHVNIIKYTLSVILKTSNKNAWSNIFWYVKVYIFWKFIQYTIYWDETQILKKFSWD